MGRAKGEFIGLVFEQTYDVDLGVFGVDVLGKEEPDTVHKSSVVQESVEASERCPELCLFVDCEINLAPNPVEV